jgi:hypothetical protein
MRERAPTWSDVTWRAGTFEETGVDTGSQAMVVGAQAFHWADPARALPELRRVLRAGGGLAILFNERDMGATPLLSRLRACIDAEVPGFAETYRGVDWTGVLKGTGDFESPRTLEIAHPVTMSAGRFLDLWRSHNQLTAAAGPAGLARIIQAMRPIVESEGELVVRYRCRAWVVRRSDH